MNYSTLPPPLSDRNAALDFMEREAKKNKWRFLCWVLPHNWHLTHLFDDAPDYPEFRGASNYAGVCLRCGARDLFRGKLRIEDDA